MHQKKNTDININTEKVLKKLFKKYEQTSTDRQTKYTGGQNLWFLMYPNEHTVGKIRGSWGA